MKYALILTAIILAAAAVTGWRDHQRFQAVRISHGHAVEEAAKRGIVLDSSNGAATLRLTKRDRENREATAKRLATDYIKFAKEKEVIREKQAEPDVAFQKRELELNDRMSSLNPAQWKILINEVHPNKDLKQSTRHAFLYNAITIFADQHPEAALAFFTETPELFDGKPLANHLVSTAIRYWSHDDPLAAMEWILNNGGIHSPLITDNTKREMISSAARHDPALAFSFISKLEMSQGEQRLSLMTQIIGAATIPQKRTATLTALRSHLATISDGKSRDQIEAVGMMMLTNQVCQEGFEAATRWLESADMTPKELEFFALGLKNQFLINPHFESAETGRWVEWVGKTLPAANAARSDEIISQLVGQWTTNDYQAAGKWLTTAPDGPAKNTAIRSYAGIVARYEPETAAQWALSLPPGEDRDSTLRKIHRDWPENDPAGRNAFAADHGIE